MWYSATYSSRVERLAREPQSVRDALSGCQSLWRPLDALTGDYSASFDPFGPLVPLVLFLSRALSLELSLSIRQIQLLYSGTLYSCNLLFIFY